MAILHALLALLALLSRSLGNIMSALFGWAVMALLATFTLVFIPLPH